MSDLYLDEIEKIKYYKDIITEELLSRGTAVNKEKLQERLDDIDLKLAIFSQAYIQSGSRFSPDTFNQQKQDLYKDLAILYHLLYLLTNQRVDKARIRMRYELDDLRTLVKEFQYLVDAQTVSVYGNTIYRKTNQFNQTYKDGQVIINLGPVTVSSGSYLAPMISSEEINQEDVTFIFQNAQNADEPIIRSSAYDYSKNYIKILGNYQLKKTAYKYNNKIFGKELIAVDDKINENSQYNLLLNENQVLVFGNDKTQIRYETKMPEVYYTAADAEEIRFCVYGASFIQIPTVGNVEYKNFTGDTIISPKQRQKIILRGNKFSFDIKTDGTVYAEIVPGIIQDAQLTVAGDFSDITDYTVEEICYGDSIDYNVSILIDNAKSAFYDIQYVIIKQARVSELEDME